MQEILKQANEEYENDKERRAGIVEEMKNHLLHIEERNKQIEIELKQVMKQKESLFNEHAELKRKLHYNEDAFQKVFTEK
jgi:hypothetical protein